MCLLFHLFLLARGTRKLPVLQVKTSINALNDDIGIEPIIVMLSFMFQVHVSSPIIIRINQCGKYGRIYHVCVLYIPPMYMLIQYLSKDKSLGEI